VKIRILVWLTVFLALGAGVARADAEKGKQFFKKKCVRCHKTTEQTLVGPGLKGVTKRVDEAWLVKWLSNPRHMLKDKDPIAMKLLKKYKVKMPTIFEFRKQEGLLQDVVDYLKTL